MDLLLQKINNGEYQLQKLFEEGLQVSVVWGERIVSYQGDEAYLKNLADLVAETFEKEVQRFCPENEGNECDNLLPKDRQEIRNLFTSIQDLYQQSNQIIAESYLSKILEVIRFIFFFNFSLYRSLNKCQARKEMCNWVTESCWDLVSHGYLSKATRVVKGVKYRQIQEENFARIAELSKQKTFPNAEEYNGAMDALVRLTEEKGALLEEYLDLGIELEKTKQELKKAQKELAKLRGN